MAADGLLAELRAADVRLWVDGGRLAFDGPAGVLTDGLLGRMRLQRGELLAALSVSGGATAGSSEDSCELPAGWVATVSGGCALLGFEELDSGCVNPDDVPICPVCSRWCDVLLLAGAWRCSRCDPASQERQRRTLRIIGSVSRFRKCSLASVRRSS